MRRIDAVPQAFDRRVQLARHDEAEPPVGHAFTQQPRARLGTQSVARTSASPIARARSADGHTIP
jgi:hypothetical protein